MWCTRHTSCAAGSFGCRKGVVRGDMHRVTKRLEDKQCGEAQGGGTGEKWRQRKKKWNVVGISAEEPVKREFKVKVTRDALNNAIIYTSIMPKIKRAQHTHNSRTIWDGTNSAGKGTNKIIR